MERRFVLFLVLSFAILFGHSYLTGRFNHQKPQPRAKAPPEAKPGAQDDGGKEEPRKKPEGDGQKPPEPPPKARARWPMIRPSEEKEKRR